MDVRRVVAQWQQRSDPHLKARSSVCPSHTISPQGRADTPQQMAPMGTFLPMVRQLHLLGLGAFEGRQHCGRDVRLPLPLTTCRADRADVELVLGYS